MKPKRGEYRYGGDCVMIGIGHYQKRLAPGKLMGQLSKEYFYRWVERLRVWPLTGLYNYEEMGWEAAHAAAYAEGERNGWKYLREPK